MNANDILQKQKIKNFDAGIVFSGKKSGTMVMGYEKPSQFTPQINPDYIFHETSRDVIVWLIAPPSPLYVCGPCGSGKSSQINQLAARLNYTGHQEWVFPHNWQKGKPMAKTALLAALRAMGITAQEMTPHGFRAMARTLLDEVLGERYDLIEHQLAHMVRDPNGRAYNRTQHLAERHRMMERWATYLDSLRMSV